MTPKLLSLYGLKFHPFRPDVQVEALFLPPALDAFLRRVELGIADGGFALLTGDPGTGKSVALRLLSERLRALPGIVVGSIEHPQSPTSDFYRELGDLFGVTLGVHNRWASFKALRARWTEHIASTLMRPVLILDEAQETLTSVLCELRILASKDLDQRQLLCSLEHLLTTAGNPSLMTAELKQTLAEHAADNYRVLMNLADELLAVALDRDLPCLDEKLFFEVFRQTPEPKSAPRRR